jgi:hypothetical protein
MIQRNREKTSSIAAATLALLAYALLMHSAVN